MTLSFALRRIIEYLQFDCMLYRFCYAVIFFFVALFLYILRKNYLSETIVASVHRRVNQGWVDRVARRLFLRDFNDNHPGRFPDHVYITHNRQTTDETFLGTLKASLDSPDTFLYNRLIILKTNGDHEKGVILLKYTNLFKPFLKIFDIDKICQRYYLVLEPSWVGYYDMDIMYYTRFDFPVFVQASEPRDFNFIAQLKSNLIPVPVGSNWWVDHRVFKTIDGIKKDTDLIMVANWTDFKRHFRLFHALKILRRSGRKLNILLVGAPREKTKDDIYNEAKYYGVHGQVEMVEGINKEQVNLCFNRSKVNIVWSRKEGMNKALIEGMFSGCPCILRNGFNYGFPYHYINKDTGTFLSEDELPMGLSRMVDNYASFKPRLWAMNHLTCEETTNILNESIKHIALSRGEVWDGSISVKVNDPDLHYFYPNQIKQYREDYLFLKSVTI